MPLETIVGQNVRVHVCAHVCVPTRVRACVRVHVCACSVRMNSDVNKG